MELIHGIIIAVIAYATMLALSAARLYSIHLKLKRNFKEIFEEHGTWFDINQSRAMKNFQWIMRKQYKNTVEKGAEKLLDSFRRTFWITYGMVVVFMILILVLVFSWQRSVTS